MGKYIGTSDGSSNKYANRYVVKSPASIAKFVVPDGVKTIYVTLVAAGGRDGATVSPLFNWATTSCAIALSANGNVCIACCEDSAVAIPFIDILAGKVANNGPNTQQGNSCGFEAFAMDNGFCFSYGDGGAWQYSIDSGNPWISCTAGYASTNTAACIPFVDSQNSPMSDVRCCYISSDRTQIYAWNGTTFTAGNTYTGKLMHSMSYANSFFIAAESNAVSKTSIIYQTQALANSGSGWNTVVVDAVNQRTIKDITYGAGLYVAVCTGGIVYTASTLEGPWTQRVSNTAEGLSAVKYNGSEFVAITSGTSDVISSIDGITWTLGSIASTSHYTTGRRHLVWDDISGNWIIWFGGQNVKVSSDGITWTTSAGMPTTTYGLISTPKGVLTYNSGSPGAFRLYTGISNGIYSTLNNYYAGGDAVIANDSGVLLRVGGGQFGASTTGGRGGATDSMQPVGGTSLSAAGGPGGIGGVTTLIPGSGTGGLTGGANLYGGGGSVSITDIGDSSYGVKFPGGAGGGWATSGKSGGGGSIMCVGGVGTSGDGPGGGQGSTTNAAGGAGEGTVRYPITVTPGETLYVSTGLSFQSSKNTGALEPNHGFAAIEWKA